MYKKLLTCLFLLTPLNAAVADEAHEKQRFAVSLGAPLKAGDDALRMVMEICEITTFRDGDRVMVIVETRDEAQLREYLLARSRAALRIDRLPKEDGFGAIDEYRSSNTSTHS